MLCRVPVKLISKLLGTITSDGSNWHNPDKTNLLISSGRNKAKLPILSPKFVFEMPHVGPRVILNEQMSKQGLFIVCPTMD